ncbi:DUF6894 family protein [Bradyrhizobium sp. 2S1]|uniref:DUF6894 family protein n=1 Tax=Bradyrhizobium sp. 2S1 TaxID=1404429 RepID=UPI0028A04352|nr:hypothetical protein [Bradyrhizobium sp. 2S1]
MERYFFDIQSGRDLFADEEGLSLLSQKAAEVEAAQTLAGMPGIPLQANGPISQWKYARRLIGFSASR